MKATLVTLKNQGTGNLKRALHISKVVHKQNTLLKQWRRKNNDFNLEYYLAQMEAAKLQFSH